MQMQMDAGTLKFWVDGKPHGPGYTSGVSGPLRWAATVGYTGNAVEIVPTPELQPWTPWEPLEEDDYLEAAVVRGIIVAGSHLFGRSSSRGRSRSKRQR